MSRIFLSHSSANSAQAIAVRDWMIAHGWNDVFLDLDPARGLKAGERWQEALKRATEHCEMVMFLVSPVWAASKWCLAEFLFAKSLNKRVFVVIVEPTPFSELPIEMTAEWQITDLTTGARDYQAMVTLPGGETAAVAFSTEGLDRLRIGLLQAGLDAKFFAWPPANDPDRPPYRGLSPLEADDAGIFFGREAPVIDALDRLRGLSEAPPPRLLVILAASGAGKSSFLRAGVLPRLAREDRQFLVLPVIRAERAAISGETGLLRALEAAFRVAKRPVARADLRAAIDGGAARLRALLTELVPHGSPAAADATTAPKPRTLVLSIDQSEELFQIEGQQEAQLLLTLLHDLVMAEGPPAVIALLTIRSDNYERLQLAKELEGVRQQALSLPPMPRGAYAEVIKGPAQRLEETPRALRIDDAVVDALLADIEVGGAKDALPLLAFTLERLHGEYGATGHLKLEHYEKLGRIEGSIEAAVERAFRAADADPRVPKDRAARLALLRRGLIPWLAGIDPDTGAPRRRVARLSEIPDEARPLVDLLIEQRLLSTDVATGTREKTIEPAHEALLRQWALLQGWLKEDAALLTVLDGVKRAARDWAANDRAAGWLTHSEERLRAAERLLERPDLAAMLEPTDNQYVVAAQAARAAALALQEAAQRREAEAQRREAEQAKRVARRTQAGLAAAVILASVAGGFGFYAMQQKTQAVQTRDEALLAQSKFLTDVSRQVAEQDKDPGTGALLALEALRDESSDDPITSGRPYWKPAELALLSARLLSREQSLLKGHGAAVKSVALSPDGTRIVSGSDDTTARIWDASSGAELSSLKGHSGSVLSVAVTPDGSRIVTGSADGTARIWDAATGAEVAQLKGHTRDVSSVAVLPDGSRIVTGSYDGTVRIWDAKTGAALLSLDGPRDRIQGVVVTSDGTRIVAAFADRTARVWDATTGAELLVLKGHSDSVESVAVSPDGKRIVTGSSDKSVRVWDSASGAELLVMGGLDSWIRSVAVTPDGTRVIAGCDDHTIRVWDMRTGIELLKLNGHGGAIWSVSATSDGARIVTGSADTTVRIWSFKSGVERATFPSTAGEVNAVTAMPDGAHIVAGFDDHQAQIMDVATGAVLTVLGGHTHYVRAVPVTPDGARVVTASADHTARVWDAKTGALLLVLKGQSGDIWSAAITPDGARIMTGSDGDNEVRIWDMQTGKNLMTLEGHTGDVEGIATTPDGARILTASDDRTVRIWDAKSGKHLATLEGHSGKVYTVAVTPDGARIVTGAGAGDKTVRIWDANTYKLLMRLEGHAARVNKVAMTPDGTRIVSGSEDKTARVWDAETGAPVMTLQGHNDSIYGLAVMPDGIRVVSGSKDKTVRVWEIPEIPRTSAASQSLIQDAKRRALRCLTPAQRQKYNLACMPPQWCIELKKWPYDTAAPQCASAAAARR